MLNLMLYKNKWITLSDRDSGKVLGTISLDPDGPLRHAKIGFQDFPQNIRIDRSDAKKGKPV